MASGPNWDARRGTWYVQYWSDGKWHRKVVARAPDRWKLGDPEPSKVPPEAHAGLAKYAAIEKESKRLWGRGVPDSLAGFLRAHVAKYAKENTRELASYAVESFLSWCDGRRITRRNQVDASVCSDYLEHLAETLSASTIHTRRAYIARAWGRLIQKKTIAPDANPWSGLDNPGQDRAKPKEAWTPEQFKRLTDKLESENKGWLIDILTFGVHTGIRIGAMMQVTWDDWIKPQSEAEGYGFIQVRAEINKTAAYKVPVSRDLNELLTRRFGKYHPTYILTGMAGNPLKDRYHTHKCIVLACKRAGLSIPQSPNHHMRRTFGRWAITGALTGRPVPVYVVSQWYGHATIEMTMNYLGLDPHESVNFMVPNLNLGTLPEATSPS